MAFRENIREFRKNDYGLENALAKICRRRWPDKTVVFVAREWSLTEAEAIKVVYGTSSKNTLNKILRHRRGGAKLGVELVFDVTNTNLESYVQDRAQEAANEAAKWESEQRSLEILQARVSERRGLDRATTVPPRTDRSSDAPLGARTHGRLEAKSFKPPEAP